MTFVLLGLAAAVMIGRYIDTPGHKETAIDARVAQIADGDYPGHLRLPIG